MAPTPASTPIPLRPVASTGVLTLRVRYCECDPMGVAHHAAYAPWLEIGRTELLRSSGVSYAQLEHAGVFLVITRLDVRYRRPICYDDVIEVRTRVTSGSRVKIEHEYELVLIEDGGHLRRPNDTPAAVAGATSGAAPASSSGSPWRALGDALARATTQLACVGTDGRVRELPDWLVSAPSGLPSRHPPGTAPHSQT